MYAVIKSGGKQYRVEYGQVIKLEKLPFEAGKTVDFNDVLMVANGENTHIGAPLVKDAIVQAEVISQGRGKKVEILKFKRRKHHMKRQGHRQDFTEVKITEISIGSEKLAPAQAEEKAQQVVKKSAAEEKK